ncbi:hypothetical protein VTI74DRAFT_5526 [Chaetomium olivicolor]
MHMHKYMAAIGGRVSSGTRRSRVLGGMRSAYTNKTKDPALQGGLETEGEVPIPRTASSLLQVCPSVQASASLAEKRKQDDACHTRPFHPVLESFLCQPVLCWYVCTWISSSVEWLG